MLKCSSAWIAGSSPAMTNTKSFSRRTCVRVVLTTTHQKIRRPAKKPREADAEGASDQCPRIAIRCPRIADKLRAQCPRATRPARGSGPTSGAARLPALRGGACQSDRTLRLSRAALHAKERAPALPAPSIALKRSTPRPGRSAAGDDARAARERGYEPRPQEPHPLHQSAVTGDVPRTNGHCAGNINGDECQ